ncbi:MAG: hypothetical protein FWE23_03790 [Chitinivibrionia bacterium]|nr:hypothetical protein [Chitinivibrionia bacterium]
MATKKNISKILQKCVKYIKKPNIFFRAILRNCEDIIYAVKHREIKTKYGNENPNSKFYIIGFNAGWTGIAWIIIHVIEHIRYAKDKNYIPLVDLQNFSSQYISPENIDKENLWEYWFIQPTEYELSAITNCKNIIKSRKSSFPNYKYQLKYWDYKNETYIKNLQSIYKKHIKFNDNTLMKIQNLQNSIIGDKKVLGIMCRGTDFSKQKPANHPIQPNAQDIIEEAEIIMKKYGCSHIFLSTEDNEIYDLFFEKFGDVLLSIPQKRFCQKDIEGQTFLSDLSVPKERKEIAFSYLASMFILSKCACFTGGITGGSLLVKIMSDGFEFEHLHDLGIYPDNVSFGEEWKRFYEELSGKRTRK